MKFLQCRIILIIMFVIEFLCFFSKRLDLLRVKVEDILNIQMPSLDIRWPQWIYIQYVVMYMVPE